MEPNGTNEHYSSNDTIVPYETLFTHFLQYKHTYKKVGEGYHRIVYAVPDNEDIVIKLAPKRLVRKNEQEYLFWRLIQHTVWKEYFIPTLWISPCKTVLVSVRSEPRQYTEHEYQEIKMSFKEIGITDVERCKRATKGGLWDNLGTCHG